MKRYAICQSIVLQAWAELCVSGSIEFAFPCVASQEKGYKTSENPKSFLGIPLHAVFAYSTPFAVSCLASRLYSWSFKMNISGPWRSMLSGAYRGQIPLAIPAIVSCRPPVFTLRRELDRLPTIGFFLVHYSLSSMANV